jgi:hypothetical protein
LAAGEIDVEEYERLRTEIADEAPLQRREPTLH